LTEAQEKARYAKTLDIMKEMEKELEVLAITIKEIEKSTSSVALKVANFEGKSQIIEKEVELESVFHGRTTTRELARRALVQSTAEANWKSLEEHPTILNIYQAIKDRRNEQEQRIEEILVRFEGIPTANEFLETLTGSEVITEICSDIVDIGTQLSLINTTQDNDRTHANQHDMKQRDKMATMETAINLIDFLQSETIISYDGAFIFLMGALAEMGKGQVEEGLRFMLKKPKEEPKDEMVHGSTEEN